MKLPGRPKFEPTSMQRAQVTALIACGTRRATIAKYFGIDQKTLSKHFAKEIREAVQDANARIAMKLYEKALSGDTVSMLFWLKCRAGWKESTRHEFVGADGKPVEVPKLGISFEAGGPGLPRQVPYRQEADERAIARLPPGADYLPDETGQNAAPIPAPFALPERQHSTPEFIPAERPANPVVSMWERLAK